MCYSNAPRIPPGQVDGGFCVAPGQVLGSQGWGWEGSGEVRESWGVTAYDSVLRVRALR